MNAADDPTSLARMHDIVVPEAVSWWPPTPFWQLLALALGAVLLWTSWRAVRRWQHDAYRRAALGALAALGAREDLSDAERVGELALLLRRTALSAWPRASVAPLTGQAWLAFLDRTGHAVRFADGAGHWLLAGTYDPSVRLPAGQYRALERETEQWIRTHRPGDG